jgi:hypothetical protein
MPQAGFSLANQGLRHAERLLLTIFSTKPVKKRGRAVLASRFYEGKTIPQAQPSVPAILAQGGLSDSLPGLPKFWACRVAVNEIKDLTAHYAACAHCFPQFVCKAVAP